MFRTTFQRLVSGLTACTLLFSLIAPVAKASGVGSSTQTAVPELLITELVPDSSNVSGSDAYEFIEVYNTTDHALDFKDYQLVYRNGATDTVWSSYNGNPDGSIPIPSKSAVVFWVMNSVNKGLATDSFANNYHAVLSQNVNVFRVEGGGGMSNAGPRTLLIKDLSGQEIVSASYQNDEQTQPDKGIFYQPPAAGTTAMIMLSAGVSAATPGTVDSGQSPPVNEPPVVTHTPVTQADSGSDLTISAQIANAEAGDTVTAAVYYKSASQPSYSFETMVSGGGNTYQAVIPKLALAEPVFQYFIQASDGLQQVKSEVFTVSVTLLDYNPEKVPPLLITEIVPDSTNVGSADGYEFIEVYNNSNQPMNFKDYKVVYRYTDSGPDADVIWPADQEDMVIPSGGKLVFWIINSQNGSTTVDSFNANYKSALVLGQDLVKIRADGMANTANRGIVIATNTGKEIVSAYYVPGDVKANKGILYKYPVDGSSTMLKISSASADAAPGQTAPAQVPQQPVTVQADTASPVLTDFTASAPIDQSKDLEIIADARDDQSVKTVTLYYRTSKQSDFVKRDLKESYSDTLYHYKVYAPELIGKAEVEYYFKASDGTHEVVSDTKRITISGGPDHSPLRLNVKEGDILTKSKVLKGNGEGTGPDDLKLSIDGEEQQASVYHALEHDAYFSFDVTGVNYYFKNGVTQGQEILYTFQDPINSYTTLSVRMPADRLLAGANVISIRAGSKSSPFDDRVEENKDDFDVKNVRLVLADGTEIYDPSYAGKDKVIKLGDSSGRFPAVDFHFDIPAEKLTSKAMLWHTETVTDGTHELALTDPAHGTLRTRVAVDNTAPVIAPTVEEGKTYRGPFVLNAEVADALAGVEAVEAQLDDQRIQLPFSTSSSRLTQGTHTFRVTATDKVGNRSERVVHFEVPDENPAPPQLVAPIQGTEGVNRNAALTVKVTDPTNDPLKVSFYRGFHFDATTQGSFKAYRNAAETEPPKQQVPVGETSFTAEDYQKIQAQDGTYLVNESVEKFPYQRFEMQLDDSVKNTDSVEVVWKGKSLPGRKVSLYAWNRVEQNWHGLHTVIAGEQDFELKGTVLAGDYTDNHKLQVMVQDEVAPAANASSDANAFDFSFAWMSDTQYYSASYPYIYQDIVKWIAEHQEEQKIKYVIHTGDIVDNASQEYQWVEADKDMKVLEDARIPYGVLAGNHDVGHQNNDYTNYYRWFGEERFKSQPTYGESYDNNRGHYDLVSSNGVDFIVVYMGWGFGDQEIDWINEVLKKYPERKAILNFHEYLLVSNNRAPMADKVFEQVIKPNKNVIAALSGHYHDSELKVDALDDNGDGVPDRNVYQMLADYQGAPEGGLGYIRLMQFDMAHGKLNIKTFSPYLNDYNYYDHASYPGKDEFTLSLDLQPVTKQVATDYFGVNVYSDQRIGKVERAVSGQQASITWAMLNSNQTYEWYAVAEDEYGGKGVSPIWRFATGTSNGEGSISNPPGNSSTPAAGQQTEPAGSTAIATRQVDGTYTIGADALKKAASAGSAGTVDLQVPATRGTGTPIRLQLNGAGIRELIQQGNTMRIMLPDLTLQIPAVAFPSDTGESDSITLVAGTNPSPELQSALQRTAAKDSAYKPSGIVFDLQLLKSKGGVESQVHQWNAPITVIRTLSNEELRSIHPEYASVYYWNGEQLEYVGGEWNGSRLTFTTDHFSEYAVMEYEKQFLDMQGHWAEVYTKLLAAKHMAEGMDADHFEPDTAVTRADFTVLAVRALGINQPASRTVFSDVNEEAYYAPFVAQAFALGLIEGDHGRFRPADTITREEAAVILMRIYAYRNGKTGQAATKQDFADIGTASEWSQASIRSAQALGLISGKENNRFDPKANLTRAEIAKLMVEAVLKGRH